jgi:hypothetical protein
MAVFRLISPWQAASRWGGGDPRPSSAGRPRTFLTTSHPSTAEEGAVRLFDQVRDACAEADGLPASLEVGLRVVLGGLAADPELARLLTFGPHAPRADPKGPEVGRELVADLGVLLGEAAAADPRASREPPFLAAFLIGGVRHEIAGLVLAGETSDLMRLLPEILECLLAFYFEPGEPQALARAALAHR